MPALKTVSTFSMSSMFLEGSPLMRTMSACFARGDCADAVVTAEIDGAIFGCDVDGFEGSEACFDEKFDFALIAESGEDAAVSGGIGPCEEQAAGLGKGEFEIHLFAHQGSHRRSGWGLSAFREVALRGLGGHGLNHAGLQTRPERNRCFEDRQRGGDGDVVRDEIVDEGLDLRAVDGKLRPACGAAARGTRSGFLLDTNSVSAKTGPCSRSSMPSAMASGQVTEQRCPVSFILCA